jgi:Domain of unknown function (DUF5666)
VAGQTLKLGLSAQSLATQSISAKIKVNGDDANELALSIGQHVTVKADGDKAGEIEIEKEVRGLVSMIDLTAQTFVIAGQTVSVTASTRIELSRAESSDAAVKHTLAEIKDGAFAEVTGERDANNLLIASSVELRSPKEHQEQGQDQRTELHGVISLLGSAAKTFTLTGRKADLSIKVNYADATVKGTLADGSRAEVKGEFDAAKKVLTAVRIEVQQGDEHGHHHEGGAPVAGATLRLEARVSKLDVAAKTLTAGAFVIDYAGATVTGTPALDVEVNLVGTVDATDTGLIHATQIRFDDLHKGGGESGHGGQGG